MASITSTGIGSGLDITGLVKNLVQAEGQAKSTQLNQREAGFQAKLSAYGSFRAAVDKLRSALASMKSERVFAGRTATSDDTNIFTTSATGTAVAGGYDVEVEQLAAAQKLRSAPFANASTVVGTGKLVASVGGKALTLTIDSANGTLAGIRDAINGAPGNPGVNASIVTGSSGAQLVLTSRDTGAASAITVTQSGGDGGLAALVYDPSTSTYALSQVIAAADARIRVDGVEATSASNTFASVIDGVTIVATGLSTPGESTRLAVGNDQAGARSRIAAFVSAYNSLVGSMGSLTSYDPKTKVAGPLLGDATFLDFTESVRRLLSGGAGGGGQSIGSLAQLGVTRNLDGTLQIDDAKLSAALSRGFDDVARFVADAQQGIATRLDSLLERYVGSGGTIDVRTRGLQASIDAIGKERDALQARLSAYESRLRTQFNALDSLVSQLRSTGDFLTQQLARLPGATSTSK